MNIKKRRKDQLIENTLSKRNLPLKPNPIQFLGLSVKILPIDVDRDSQELYEISNGSQIVRCGVVTEAYDCNELIWKYTGQAPFSNANDFTEYLKDAMNRPNTRLFCIFNPIEDYQIGVCGYSNNEPEHLKIDIGLVWISPMAQGTKAATEMCYLLLNHAFKIGYRRVQWLIASENIRSYKLAIKAGFVPDMTQKNCMIVKNIQEDVTIFRILDYEWPERKMKLKEILYKN